MLFSRFLFIFLLVITITFDAVFAIPLSHNSDPPPKIPSVEELMKKHLVVQKDNTLFYTGISRETCITYQQATGRKTMTQSWKDPNFRMPFKADARVTDQFFDRAAEALAKMAKGEVHILMPESSPDAGRPGSAWNLFEWPNLQRKGVVVIRVNVDKSGKIVGMKTIWPKGR